MKIAMKWIIPAAALLGATTPIGLAAARIARAPRDLLTRVRRRTRPLKTNQLYEPHDLVG